MPAIPVLTTIEVCKTANKYFCGVFFKPLNIEEKDIQPVPVEARRLPLSVIKSFFDNKTQTLDLYGLSKQKPFSGLFPEDEEVSLQECRQITQKIKSQTDPKKGGVLGFFIEKKDDKFIEKFNKIPEITNKFIRNDENSVPKQFFEAVNNFSIYPVYDSDNDKFRWDFSDMLRFLPSSIYEAFLRFGHAKYTILRIGGKGYEDILAEAEPEYKKISKRIESNITNEKKELTVYDINKAERFDKKLEVIQEALESSIEYTPETLKQIKNKYIWLIENRYSFLKRKINREKIETNKYDKHKDNVNIENYRKKITPLIAKYGTEKEKLEFKEAVIKGPYSLIPFLFNIIVNPNTSNPDISKEFDRSKQIISGLYHQAFDPLSLNMKVGEDGEDELQDIIPDPAAEDFTDIINETDDNKEIIDNLREKVYNAFNKVFAGKGKANYKLFLDFVVSKKTFKELCEDLLEYKNETGQYYEKELFIDFCEKQGFISSRGEMKAKKHLLGPIHNKTKFKDKIKIVLTIIENEARGQD